MKFRKFSFFVWSLTTVTIWVWAVSACRQEQKPLTSKKEKVVETLEVLGALPETVTHPADNPTSAGKVTLGRLLFFDPILSGNKDVACASCHQPEFNYSEFLETSVGVNGVGTGSKRHFLHPNTIPFVKRNSQSVLNTAFNGITNSLSYRSETAPMFWDLRAEGLEAQAIQPILTLEEMRGAGIEEDEIMEVVLARIKRIPQYNRLFQEAFHPEKNPVNASNLAKSLAAYERSLVANHSRFDQFMRGDRTALTTGEQEGLQLFLKAGCAKCHSGPMLSDFKLHTLGVPDTENRKETDKGRDGNYAFRTPTLRNLRFTAPYMHSGKFTTLEQVLTFYEDVSGGKIHNPHVSRSQMDTLATQMTIEFKDISRIIEFLHALNDDSFDKTIPSQVPSGLPVGGK